MNSGNIERLIKNLGCSYDALVANGVIDSLPLEDLYDDGESLVAEPLSGVELVFWAENSRFEIVYIVVAKTKSPDNSGPPVQLPAGYNEVNNQSEVRSIFGEPAYFKGPLELQGTGLGGWDTYQVAQSLHPAVLVDFQYGAGLRLENLVFSLIDKNVS